jgi:Tfp pilus assembly protein PilV
MLKSNNQGISIIEAVLATAVLAIGILSIITLFPLALKISKGAEQETVAANLAQGKIEEIFSLGYENIATGTLEARHRLSSDPTNPFYNYERQTVSQLVDGNLDNSATDLGLKKITATMYWQTPNLNIAKELPVTILISQK